MLTNVRTASKQAEGEGKAMKAMTPWRRCTSFVVQSRCVHMCSLTLALPRFEAAHGSIDA